MEQSINKDWIQVSIQTHYVDLLAPPFRNFTFNAVMALLALSFPNGGNQKVGFIMASSGNEQFQTNPAL